MSYAWPAEKLHSALIPSYPPFTRHLPSSLSSFSPSQKKTKPFVLPNELASCQKNTQINKHGSHTSSSKSSESPYHAVRHLEMCLCAQNSIRGSEHRGTLWFVLWNLLDEWLMPPGKCPRFTITKTMALDTEHRSLGFHTDRSSGCCFLLNPKCWLPIHATSPKRRDTHKGNSQPTQWLIEQNNSFFHRSLSTIFPLWKTKKRFPFSVSRFGCTHV